MKNIVWIALAIVVVLCVYIVAFHPDDIVAGLSTNTGKLSYQEGSNQ